MSFKVENHTANENLAPDVKTKKQNEPKKIEIPIVKEEEEKSAEKKIDGYYLEKTSKKADSKKSDEGLDDEFNTDVDPNARITVNPSITIYKNTSELTDAVEQSTNRLASEAFSTSGENAYYKATDMIKDKQAYSFFDDINFTKRFSVYGKSVYERRQNMYQGNTSAKMTKSDNSMQFNIGLNYKSKSEKTKAMLFSSFNKTYTKLELTERNDTGEENILSSGTDQFTNYSIFGALKQEFKNNDFGTLSAFYINDNTLDAKTANIDASYFVRKYMAMMQGNVNIYSLLNQKSITKVDFDISLNPELASDFKEKEEPAAPEVEAESEPVQEETAIEQNTKKWSKNFSPFFSTQSFSGVKGSTEEGIGGKFRLKRTGDNSTLKVNTFGKFSTTQQDESNQYHLTFGSGIKYSKKFNKFNLDAKGEIKDRITFCHGNILTANADVSLTSNKVTAELEGKYIYITHDSSPNYAGVVGRIFYTPNKNINLFAETSYTYMKYPETKNSGYNFQTGFIINTDELSNSKLFKNKKK